MPRAAQHEAQRDAAAPAGDVAGEYVRDTHLRLALEGSAQAMFGDSLREAIVDRPIFNPSAGQTGDPQNDAGERGEEDRAAAKGVQGFDGILRGILRDKRSAHGGAPDVTEGHSAQR